MPKRGRRRKKNRTHAVSPDEASGGATALVNGSGDRKIPKSLVTRKGSTAAEVSELVTDLRRLMQPYTAVSFQDDPKNRKLTLQQYSTHLALPMGITHILQFSQKDDRCNLRLARLPEGPVLTLRVHQFSLSRHIVRLQKRPVAWTGAMNTCPPVVVTNNFGDHTAPPHVKLMRITFQNLFPQINVSTVKLKDCRRVVLFDLVDDVVAPDGDNNNDEEQQQQGTATTRQIVHVRHFAVRATPVGVHRRIRRLIHNNNKNKALPNLNKCQDIADYLTSNAVMSDAPSDSEPEDGDEQVVQLSDQYVGKGNGKNQTAALKLVELGPRMSWQLIKVEKGLDGANSPCLYHAHVTKTAQEAAALQAAKDRERELKQQRRAHQESNVERKRLAAEEKRERKRQKRQEHAAAEGPKLLAGQRIEGVSSSSSSSEEDGDSGDDE
jgi:ribosome biogenesis protein SSF1/2